MSDLETRVTELEKRLEDIGWQLGQEIAAVRSDTGGNSHVLEQTVERVMELEQDRPAVLEVLRSDEKAQEIRSSIERLQRSLNSALLRFNEEAGIENVNAEMEAAKQSFHELHTLALNAKGWLDRSYEDTQAEVQKLQCPWRRLVNWWVRRRD